MNKLTPIYEIITCDVRTKDRYSNHHVRDGDATSVFEK